MSDQRQVLMSELQDKVPDDVSVSGAGYNRVECHIDGAHRPSKVTELVAETRLALQEMGHTATERPTIKAGYKGAMNPAIEFTVFIEDIRE